MALSIPRSITAITLLATLSVMSGCAMFGKDDADIPVRGRGPSNAQEACMARAMYFESNRSSRDGMIAVGTVVMNRVRSADFPNSVCKVVGQRNQFAPGIMTKPMNDSGLPLVLEAASAVMHGERHPLVQNARFFHAAGHTFPYDNMHYVVTAGGNAFYEKRKSNLVTQPVPLPPTEGLTPY